MRAVANAVAQWMDKLGGVWVEGQIAQVNRRPGVNTVFMTLRDTVADISVTLTCARSLFDSMNPPLVEGASVVVHARPSFYANRGSFSLAAREIKMVGLGELLARLERRRQLLAAEGLFAPELKRATCRSSRAGWAYNIFYIIYKYFSITHFSGMQYFFCCFHNQVYWNITNYYFYLYFR